MIEIKSCIVKIETNDSQGTGFFIDKNKILTCFHIIKDNSESDIKVIFNRKEYPIKIVDKKEEFEIDLAILEIDVINENYLNIDKTIDDKLRSYGFANSEDYYENAPENFDRGCVPVSLEYEGNDEHFMKFKNGQVEEGHSGSPIINLNTKSVCGVLNASRNTDNSLGGYGIPIEKLELLKYQDRNDNEITKTINLKNGKPFSIELVKVELEDNRTIYVGKYPITFEEYDIFCEDTGREKPLDRWGRGKQPVIYIDFKNAKKYAKWLTEHSNSLEYVLPSSTDWLEIYKINNLNNHLSVIVWYNKKETSEVNVRDIPNSNICDMFGNVAEWCSDKVSIGGSFRNETLNRMQEKIKRNKTDKFDYLGFRIISITKKEL